MTGSARGFKPLLRRGVALLSCLLVVGLLSGCSLGGIEIRMGRSKPSDGSTMRLPEKVAMTPVQDYTGGGFKPEDSDSMRQPVQDQQEEIKRMVVSYMHDHWNTEVKVNAVWPTSSGAQVNVSCADPQFTVAVQVKMDKQGHIKGDPEDLWQNIKASIISGLYYRAWQQEYDQFNAFLGGEAKALGLLGLRPEAISKTRSAGYETPWLYLQFEGPDFDDIINAYTSGENLSAQRLRPMFEQDILNTEQSDNLGERGRVMETSIQMYAPTKKLPPQSSVDRVERDLTVWAKSHTLPPTGYTIKIFGNSIANWSGMPDGDSVNTGEEQKANGTLDTRYLYFNGNH
ncbi:lipoprotein [Bifidobacterium actinocoloniiforme DSM 22766]|uniref:Lipoprotein n=1 Tax=Bifidobacterium actinocoloniiforme DSM 22766 TaxID=1437605 RepID=A0A086Z190_9BIFI|nr:DUF1672 family protein [Bifidobacterium actinocoloniiforme]AKV55453.1 hypothetical protein AB656_03570 [Bifidobacterium actinocoloniiforme DSM 22766]KFI40290.1 lipoprotein [Bifidobacterium actinocoloniiforme DSM 22766]